MKLHGHPMSTCTRKVLCLLNEKGKSADFVTVDITKGEQKTPDHMGLQPFGQVPALDDDGFVLYESRAIIRYLDEKLGGTRLGGADLKARALVEQWISVEAMNFSAPAMKVVLNRMFKRNDAEAEKAALTDLEARALPVMDRQLGRTPFIAGGDFTLADICFMPYVEYLIAVGESELISKFPNVDAWWKRVSARPSWQKAIGKA